MQPNEVERIVASILSEQLHSCCKDGNCSDGLCVIHNKEGVKNIVHNGAERVTAGIGIEAAGGIDSREGRTASDSSYLMPTQCRE